ncbi:hypothetical protein [uncultured Spirosoma sp.]|uniref:hypothetical protein n=1 Tax=uncultured Spirosoma sp. TaxID=278208 RepID=UPI002589FBE5|nr:hypothetical protein [uncultured Spirosoma sp.]
MHSSLPVLTVVGLVCLGSLSAMAQQTSSTLALSATSQADVIRLADSSSSKVSAVSQLLKTRCLDTGLLRLGSTCTFQVTEPVIVGDRAFAVGDRIHAHVEEVKGVTGRVFMRTDRIVSAKTQETTVLSMVAVEQPRQPGVSIPHLLDGWKLSWEQR